MPSPGTVFLLQHAAAGIDQGLVADDALQKPSRSARRSSGNRQAGPGRAQFSRGLATRCYPPRRGDPELGRTSVANHGSSFAVFAVALDARVRGHDNVVQLGTRAVSRSREGRGRDFEHPVRRAALTNDRLSCGLRQLRRTSEMLLLGGCRAHRVALPSGPLRPTCRPGAPRLAFDRLSDVAKMTDSQGRALRQLHGVELAPHRLDIAAQVDRYISACFSILDTEGCLMSSAVAMSACALPAIFRSSRNPSNFCDGVPDSASRRPSAARAEARQEPGRDSRPEVANFPSFRHQGDRGCAENRLSAFCVYGAAGRSASGLRRIYPRRPARSPGAAGRMQRPSATRRSPLQTAAPSCWRSNP